MRTLMNRMRAAMQKYRMVAPGDRIAVGVSGGRDSLTMLAALNGLRPSLPDACELIAVAVDPGCGGVAADFSAVVRFCAQMGVPCVVRPVRPAGDVPGGGGEAPCALCAARRREALFDAAGEAGCGKAALGCHLDDAVAAFYTGRIGGFSPVSSLPDRDLTLIRPMIFAPEREVGQAARTLDLPEPPFRCPDDERRRVRERLDRLQKESGYASLYQKTLDALRRAGADGRVTEE